VLEFEWCWSLDECWSLNGAGVGMGVVKAVLIEIVFG